MLDPKLTQEPSESGDWKDSTDYENCKYEKSPFEYNPAAGDITKQTGDFPQPTDVEAPEKM